MKKAYVRPEVEYINFYSDEQITNDGIMTVSATFDNGGVVEDGNW